jgi:ankyrin repeat protein
MLNNGHRFRWAQLSLQVLHGLTSERAIRDRLGKLPPKLQGIYSIIFDGIMKGGGDGSRILPRILLWLMYGRSISMKSKDFLDVVSSDVGRSSENINKLELLDLCGNLVEWDRKQDTFRIAHLSVREFLEEGNDADFQIFRPFQGHVSLARTCLNHLGNCRSSHSPPFVGFSRFMCGYANLWWPWHIEQAILLEREETDQIVYKNCIGDFTALDVQRLQDNWDAISFSAMEAYVANDQRKGSLSEFVEMAEAGSIFGMLHLNTMVNTRIPKESSSWTTGFFKAVLEHDLASLRKLIYHPERNLNITDGGGMSALHIAVTTGQLDVAELLLVNDADPNVQTQINDYRGRVTHAEAAEGLIYAKCNHNRLHTWGALPTYGTNNDGRFTATVCGSFTPLHLAAMQGSLGFVELLIRKNADFNRYTRIQEFLGQGNSILLYNNSGRMKVDLMGSVTPLHLAVQYYHLDVARYLVQAGADINAFSLPFNGQLSIAKLINNNGRVKITHRTSISAIAYAIQHGDEDFVDFLLSRNAKLDNEFAIQLTTPNHSFTLHIGVLINNSGRLELESTHNGTGRLNIDLLITGKGRTTFSNRLPMPLYNLAKENDLGEKYFEVFGHPSKAANLPRGGKLQGSPSTNEKFEDPLENESSLKEKPKTEEENFKVLVKSGVIFTGGRLNINDSRFKG